MASTRPRRGVVAAALLVLVVALGLRPDAAAAAASDCTTGEGEVATSSVLVQVVFPSGTYTRCVAPGGTGLDVLRRAGLAIEVQSFGSKGGAVCGITDPEGSFVGCPDGPDCLTCPAAGDRYWGYFRCYTYSPVGAGSTTPAGGTIEGWRFGGGGGWTADKPAACDDGRVDHPPATTPTPTSAPTATTAPNRPPSGGGGVAIPRPGDPDTGGTTPSGGSTPGATVGPDGSTTTGPAGSSSSTTTSSTTAPAGEDDERAEGGAGGAGGAEGSWQPTDGEQTAAGLPTGDRSGGDGGGGAPVVPLGVTALVLAGVAALVVRIRRSRAVDPAT